MNKFFVIIIYYGSYLIFPVIFFLVWQIQKRKKNLIELIILLIISIIFIWSRFIEPNIVIKKEYNLDISNTKNKTLRVAVLSDVHVGVYNKKSLLNRAINKIKKTDIDLLIIPGDFVYAVNKNKLDSYFSSFANLSIAKIAVLGNHDYGKGPLNISKDIIRSLESNGVLMVDNEIKTLEINRDKIRIIGLADIWTGDPDYSVLDREKELEDQVDIRILVAHNPDTIFEFDTEKNKEIDIMISGHTHAGQIRLPFVYKRMIPSKHQFDKGFYEVGGIDIFVTPGIGNVVLPLRLFNFPEVSILNLKY